MDLILNTFGTSLSKENGNFLVVHKDGKQSISPDGIKSILISRGAQLSSDAAMLAIQHEIDVLFLDHSGDTIGRIWSSKYGSVSTIRKGQLEFSFSKDAVVWIKEVVAQKVENQQAMLLSMMEDDAVLCEKVLAANRKLDDYRSKILQVEGDVVPDVAASLRGWEGAASRIYFETINRFLPEDVKFLGRSQHPATDLVNCMLNYAYGILYGKIEGALIKAGVDPYVGVFHRDDYNRPVLVFDVIELYRIWADYVVFSLAMQQVVTDDFYSVKSDGSYWLENLGRRIVIQSMNDYLEEVVMMGGMERSRQVHIDLYAQNLAQKFKRYC